MTSLLLKENYSPRRPRQSDWVWFSLLASCCWPQVHHTNKHHTHTHLHTHTHTHLHTPLDYSAKSATVPPCRSRLSVCVFLWLFNTGAPPTVVFWSSNTSMLKGFSAHVSLFVFLGPPLVFSQARCVFRVDWRWKKHVRITFISKRVYSLGDLITIRSDICLSCECDWEGGPKSICF